MRRLQAARWPVVTRIVAVGTLLERVKLPLPPSCTLSDLLLLCMLSCDAPGGVTNGEVAEFVGFGARQGSHCLGVASVSVRVDGAHPELIAACLLGTKFTGQHREPFLLVSP